MTISRRQPLLYYLLLIILLQRSARMGDGAVLYLNDNYGDDFYEDMNYYDTFANPNKNVGTGDGGQTLTQQDPIDDAQIGDEQGDPVQQLDSLQSAAEQDQYADEQERLAETGKAERLGMTDKEAAQRKREARESANAPHQDQEQKAAYTCHAQTPEQQASLDAAVKDTKDTIEHVTTLIKGMREHAVAIVKEINELEGDFLGACQEDRPKPSCPRRPPVSKGNCKAPFGIRQEDDSGAGGGYIDFKRIDNEADNNNNNNPNKVIYVSNNNNQNENENRNDNENNGQRVGDNNNNNNREGGANNPNVNTNTNTKPNTKGVPTKSRILVNEFAMPIKSDTSDLPPNEFIEQAQYAVHAWKHQIEECKRLLDEAMLHAAQQQQSTDSADSPNTSVQHIIKIVEAPEDDAAPAAAASITPVRSTKEPTSNSANNINNNNNNNINNANAGGLKEIGNIVAALKIGKTNDDKLAVSGVGSKAVHGDTNNDADTDINVSSNNKRNEDAKKCRSDSGEKKHRATPPLLSVLQGMGF